MSLAEVPIQPLPAFTICTYNRVRCRDLLNKTLSCHQTGQNCTQLDDLCELSFHSACLFSLTGLITMDEFVISEVCPKYSEAVEQRDNRNMSQAVYNDRYAYLTPEERIEMGMRASSMVTKCTFENSPCNETFRVVTINFVSQGNCFIFNARGPAGSVRTGREAGIRVQVYLAKEEFTMDKANTKEGLRLTVHSPGEIPLVDEKGIDLKPGTLTSVGLRMTSITRQPYPYPSKCIGEWNTTALFFMDDYQKLKGKLVRKIEILIQILLPCDFKQAYTQVGCIRICALLKVMEKCGCVYHKLDDLTLRDLHRQHGIQPNQVS